MKNKLSIFAPVVFAIIIGSMTFIFAQTNSQTTGQFPGDGKGFRPPPMDGPGGRGGIPPQVLDKLNLTDAQKQQIKTLMDNARTASKSQFDKLRGFDDELKTVADAASFNEDAARQILTAKAQVMTELEIVHLKTDIAIKNILTAEQKTQLEQLKLQRPDFGRGQRPGMPPPPPQN